MKLDLVPYSQDFYCPSMWLVKFEFLRVWTKGAVGEKRKSQDPKGRAVNTKEHSFIQSDGRPELVGSQ